VPKSTCEGCRSDEGYFRGLSRDLGLGDRFEIGFRAGLRTGFRFRFRFGFRFRTPLGNLLQRIYRTLIDRLNTEGIEFGFGSDRAGILNWSL